MVRRHIALIASLLAVAAIVAGCSGAPPAPKLTDPKEILTKGLAALRDAKTFHLKAEVAGSVNLDLGQGAGQIDLRGTSANGDVDVAGKKAKVSFSAPLLLGLTGDVIQIDQTTYTRVSLTGEKYRKSVADTPAASPATDPQQLVTELSTALDKLPNPPKRLADEKVGDSEAYHVQVIVPAANLQDALGSGSGGGAGLPSAAGLGDATVDIWVAQDSLRPVKATIQAGGQQAGTLTVTLTLSGWDQAVTIDAPPADQVEAGT